jgi:RsiW-degrading membrane proteinase PrsW (M82 family)
MSNAAELDPLKLTSYLPREAASLEVGLFSLNTGTVLGLLALGCITLYGIRYIQQQNVVYRKSHLHKSLFLVVLFSLGFTMATQWVGHTTYDYLRPKGEQTEASHIQKKPDSQKHTRATRAGAIAIMAMLSVMVIGGGYAFTAMHDLSLPLHILGLTFGVGLCIELGKLIAVSLLLTPTLDLTKSRRSLIPFVLTGLGFGIGEALFYFRDYAATETFWLAYCIRGTWSVFLQISWCTISGYMIVKYNKEVPETSGIFDVFNGGSFWAMLILMLPSAILHGVHDAFIVHKNVDAAAGIGMISIALGWMAALRFKKIPRPKPDSEAG